MFKNKKYIKFLQKSKALNSDIICVNILEDNEHGLKRSIQNMFINSNGETIGFDLNSEFKNFVVTHAKKVLQTKKGRLLKYNKDKYWASNSYVHCWIEPFYYEDDYGYMGEALKKAIKGQDSTLVRSIKFSGAHSFISSFDEQKNSLSSNKNLFYEKINSPIKLLILGYTKGSMELVKASDLLGWQICLCDLKGSNFKRIKHLDEIVLLNCEKNVKKVLDKNFDIAIIIDNQSKKNLYIDALLNSSIANIAIFGAGKEIKNSIDKFNMKNNVVIDDRVKLVSNYEYKSFEKVAYEACRDIENKIYSKRENVYEFI